MTVHHPLLDPSRDPARTVDLSTPAIIGHRGMGVSHRNPANPYVENTRASFLAAYTAGARWVELDILPSADGDLMLHHDHYLVAFGGDTRPIWQVGTDELRGLGIEPLDGLCDDLPADLGLYLELKVTPGDVDARYGPASVASLIEWVHAHAPQRHLLAATFDPYVALDLHGAGVPTAWITDHTQPFHTTMTATVRAGLDALVVRGSVLDAPAHELAVAQDMARDHAVAVWSWYPAIDHIPHYRDLGVTGFCVDDVAAAVAALHLPDGP